MEVSYEMQMLQGELLFDDTVVLTYKITYPQFSSRQFAGAVRAINLFYQQKAKTMERNSIKKLYPAAVQQYVFNKKNGYPSMQYQMISECKVTYTADCTISLFCDAYTYQGGANGMTVRTSDTWDLRTSRRRPLSSFFPRGTDVQAMLTAGVIAQIEAQEDEEAYFDDYQESVQEFFDPDNYYLTPDGLTLYYQVYDIAPHSSGIPEFLFPWQRRGPIKPRC